MSKLLTQHQPARWLRLFYLLVMLLPLTGKAQIVISQAYGGGGNSGSVYKNDFIELFNRGTSAVNVTGWTVQYASTTGTFSTANSTTLSGTIQPGRYYLIQEAAGSGGTTNLPTPDATGTISMGGTGFRLALVNNTTVATATTGPNSTFSANVVDFLGSGGATAYEGATPAPAPSNTTANLRAGAGCTDTNVNGDDFTAVAPTPRNSASPVNSCASPAEINVQQAGTTYLTASTYSGFAITTIGNTDTKAFTIENTGGTALTINSVVATGDFSVSGAPATVAAGSSQTFNVIFTPTAAGTRTGTLTISNSDSDEGSYVINLSAEGQSTTLNPEINVQVASTNYLTGSTYSGFANTATGASSAAVTFTIQNTSTTDALTISSIYTTGEFSVSGLATPASVPASSSVTVSVVFSPTATGTRSGTLVISSNDQDEATYTITLQGEGVNPVPTISTITPSSATAGDAGFTLTVNGTGFVSGAVVSFDGTSRTTTFVSATQLTAAILAADVATAGTYNVVVTNPTPGGGASTAATFTVNPLPAPTLTSINPSTITAGTATTVTFTGTNFVSGSTVSFNGATLTTTFVNSTTVRASITPPAQSATATYQVSVTTPSGTTGNQTLTATGVFTLVPISIAAVNTPVTEDFNTLASTGTASKTTLPTGFDFIETDTGADSFYTASNGSATSGDTYSFGSTSADRALGTLLSGSLTSRFGAQYINNTGQTITSLAISYTGEEWRLGTASRTDRLDFQYSTTATGVNTGTYVDVNTLDFVTPNTATIGAKDGNLAANRTALTTTITGLSIANGATFFIRWLDADATSADDGLAVDDLSVTANPQLVACSAPGTPTFSNITQTSADVTVAAGPNGTGPYTVTATPTGGGAAITATGASPVSLTGLTAGTTYSVTVTSDCNAGYSSPSQASAAATLTTTAAPTPTPTLAVSQSGTSYPSGGTAYNFGSQTLATTSAPVPFTLTNNGTGALTISSITTTGDFAVSGTAPTTVAVGSTATVSVTFTPTALSTRTGTLVINSDATTGAVYTVNLTGNGTAVPLSDLTVSTGSLASPTLIGGNYNNVTITGTGVALLAGPLTVAGTLTVQTGGILGQNCQVLSGTGNFTLQAGATFIICDPLGISPTGVPTGAVLLTGTRTYSPSANYIYNGTVAQFTGLGLPATVLAVGVQNPAGVSLSQGLSLVQGLQLQAGNLNTNGQPFVLLSTATGTAGVVNAGGVVNGTATVQRYIDNPNPIGYRHYSAPVSNTTVNDLATSNFNPTFNTAYNTSPTPSTVTPFPTVFGYDETRVGTVTSTYGPFDQGWYVPAAGTPMAVNRGYSVNAPNTALVDFVGLLNNGNQNSGSLSFTSANGGWQLLGNPYPAPLDWSTVSASQRPGMDAAMYVFQSSGQYGGSYRTYANGVGASPLIPTASGYFTRVAAQGTSGSVNLTNANRVTTLGAQPAFGRGTADTRPQLQLQLSSATAGLDEMYIYFEAGATAGRDAEYDAAKLANPSGLNLASLAGSQELAINGLPALGNAAVLVPLTVRVPQAGSYRLEAGELANFTGAVTLIDALTGTRTVLTTGTSYAFAVAGTSATGRFTVEFRPSGVLATTAAQALSAQVQLFPNPASGSFRLQLPVLSSKAAVSATLVNALGQTVLTRSLSAPAGQAIDAAFDVRGLAAGVYTLRLNVAGTPLVRKVVVE